ncbi:MAG: hypothetical protein J2P21_01855 [Chloracidobacterium sp.]|nr:hypothetical protein [Chloracidobacterium sp.]
MPSSSSRSSHRTLEFDKALSARHILQIVNRWAEFAGLNQDPDKDDPDRLGSKKKKSRLRGGGGVARPRFLLCLAVGLPISKCNRFFVRIAGI